MLDLRGTNPAAQPEGSPVGVPPVGATSISFDAPTRRSSPILESGAKAPTGKGIVHVGDTTPGPVVMIVSIVAVAIAGAAGLVASYLVTQQQARLLTEENRHSQLVTQLTTGTTGAQLQRIQTTAQQLAAVGQQSGATPWVDLLDALSGQMPGAIQLTNVTFDSQTKVLTLNGNGTTYEDVAKAIASLETSTRFEKVSLQNAAEAQDEDTVQVDFAITATYVPVLATPVPVTATQGATQ